MSLHDDERRLAVVHDDEDEGEWPIQTSGSRHLSNRTILTIMVVFIVAGGILIGAPTVFSFFQHR